MHSVQESTAPDKLVKPVRWEDVQQSIESKLVKQSAERVRKNKNLCFARSTNYHLQSAVSHLRYINCRKLSV